MRAARSWVIDDAVAAYGTSVLTVETPGARWRALLICERRARVHIARPDAVVVMTIISNHGEAAISSSSRRPSPSVSSDVTMSPIHARARRIRDAEAKKVAARPSASSCAWGAVARGPGCIDGADNAGGDRAKVQDVHARTVHHAAAAATAGRATLAASATRAGYFWPRLPAPRVAWLQWPRGRRPRRP